MNELCIIPKTITLNILKNLLFSVPGTDSCAYFFMGGLKAESQLLLNVIGSLPLSAIL